MFRRLGYVVVAPDSTASGREITCPTKIYSVLARHQEIDDAVEKTTAWPWVDRSRLVLAGHSEGGIATALYARPGVVRAKIIMGWTCTAGSDAYHGLRGVDPALSFVFDRDPWNVQNRGDCGSAMRPPSKSVVFPGSEHDVVMYHRDRVSNEIGSFLRAVLADAR
jgi:dienelactone hydrolase